MFTRFNVRLSGVLSVRFSKEKPDRTDGPNRTNRTEPDRKPDKNRTGKRDEN